MFEWTDCYAPYSIAFLPAAAAAPSNKAANGAGSSATAAPGRVVPTLLVCDDRCVRKIDGGVQTCVAGSRIQGYVDAPGAKAKFVWLQSLIVTSDGTRAFMADGGNARIRWIDLTDAAYPVATFGAGDRRAL